MGEGGRIISMSSGLAVRTFPGTADYSATKAAIVGYTKAAARDLGPRKITVNALQIGSIATDMNPEDGPSADFQRSANALGRYGRPEEIAAAVVFLASPAASFMMASARSVSSLRFLSSCSAKAVRRVASADLGAMRAISSASRRVASI